MTAKTEQYRSRAKILGEICEVSDDSTFLKSIDVKPRCLSLNEATITRAVQLCAKTNQFNLRLIRYNEADLLSIIENPRSMAFMFELDKFGDHGIVGLVIASQQSKNKLFLDTFLMSCRILGRHLEAWGLEELRKKLI